MNDSRLNILANEQTLLVIAFQEENHLFHKSYTIKDAKKQANSVITSASLEVASMLKEQGIDNIDLIFGGNYSYCVDFIARLSKQIKVNTISDIAEVNNYNNSKTR